MILEQLPNSATAPLPSSGSGSAWSTVGSSGKVAKPSTGGPASTPSSTVPTGIAALPPRPSAAAIASSGMRAAHNSAAATSSLGAVPAATQTAKRSSPATSAAVVAAGSKTTGKTSNVDEVAHAGNVSTETLKWMRETLKGKLVKGITGRSCFK